MKTTDPSFFEYVPCIWCRKVHDNNNPLHECKAYPEHDYVIDSAKRGLLDVHTELAQCDHEFLLAWPIAPLSVIKDLQTWDVQKTSLSKIEKMSSQDFNYINYSNDVPVGFTLEGEHDVLLVRKSFIGMAPGLPKTNKTTVEYAFLNIGDELPSLFWANVKHSASTYRWFQSFWGWVKAPKKMTKRQYTALAYIAYKTSIDLHMFYDKEKALLRRMAEKYPDLLHIKTGAYGFETVTTTAHYISSWNSFSME